MSKSKYSLRTKVALAAAKTASFLSKKLHLGQGEMINGLIGLKIDSNLIKELTQNMQVILVTGTNGKSTTTRMIAEILSTQYEVATQKNGANMDAGIAAALMENQTAQIAVLEVDEMHLEHISALTNPDVIVILNLSRDQLDRVGELSLIGKTIAKAVKQNPQAKVVANADNVLAAYSARVSPNPIWVAAGVEWHNDSTLEPTTGERILYEGNIWHNSDNTFRRPSPTWWHEGNTILGPNDFKHDIKLQIPGHFNVGNALSAIAVGDLYVVKPEKSISRLNQISEIAGRYKTFDLDNRKIKLILAKNPAGWQSSINTINENFPLTKEAEIIIGINGQVADGQDLSWLWDVNFEELQSYKIVACGERGADLSVRLFYANIKHSFTPNLISAVNNSKSRHILVLANYTAFRDLLAALEKKEAENGKK